MCALNCVKFTKNKVCLSLKLQSDLLKYTLVVGNVYGSINYGKSYSTGLKPTKQPPLGQQWCGDDGLACSFWPKISLGGVLLAKVLVVSPGMIVSLIGIHSWNHKTLCHGFSGRLCRKEPLVRDKIQLKLGNFLSAEALLLGSQRLETAGSGDNCSR